MRMRRSRRRKRKHSSDEVSLNMAAMLDMAFQLLAFFILTFKASPIEAQIALRLPDNAPSAQTAGVQIGTEEKEFEDMELPLTLDLFALPDGSLDKIVIGSKVLKSPDVGGTVLLLRNELLAQAEQPVFDSVVVRVDNDLHYEPMMQVVDLCTRQKTTKGEPMTKISIVPLKK